MKGFTDAGCNKLKIAILSGKGGTGKTLVSVNLAHAAGTSAYIDCDVEEPDGHIFFKPEITGEFDVFVKMPVVDNSLCTGCKECVDFCNFNALAYAKSGLLIFEDICHSCGGCTLLCPEKALHEVDKHVGVVHTGKSGDVSVATGTLDIGVPSGIPVIARLMEESEKYKDMDIFIDCPPGSSCAVMESIKDADYCILVVEPTIFGVHNFKMVMELVKLFNKPYGIIINKHIDSDNPADKFLKDNNMDVLTHIPYDEELGDMNSRGKIVAKESTKYMKMFKDIYEKINKEANSEAASNIKR